MYSQYLISQIGLQFSLSPPFFLPLPQANIAFTLPSKIYLLSNTGLHGLECVLCLLSVEKKIRSRYNVVGALSLNYLEIFCSSKRPSQMDCECNILAEFHRKLDLINLTPFLYLLQASLLYVLIKRKMVYCICTTEQNHDKCC